MFNIGSGEIVVIAIVALLILGPKRLPELARGIGKFVREFRRHTDEVRGVVEREFYRMDQDVSLQEPAPPLAPAAGAQPVLGQANRPLDGAPAFGPPMQPKPRVVGEDVAEPDLPPPSEPIRSQLTAGMPAPSPEPEPAAPPAAPTPEKQ